MKAEPADGAGCPAGYAIRPRREQDDDVLVIVENRAAQLFRDHGYPGLADNPLAGVQDFRAMIAGHETWVATDPAGEPVGYAVAGPRGSFLHLRELSVDPAHGRKGLGSALVRAVIGAAQRRGVEGVSLTTFRAVPFNAPFYAGLGFVELPPEDTPHTLRKAFADELPPGVDPARRVPMLLRFRQAPAET